MGRGLVFRKCQASGKYQGGTRPWSKIATEVLRAVVVVVVVVVAAPGAAVAVPLPLSLSLSLSLLLLLLVLLLLTLSLSLCNRCFVFQSRLRGQLLPSAPSSLVLVSGPMRIPRVRVLAKHLVGVLGCGLATHVVGALARNLGGVQVLVLRGVHALQET